MPEYEHMCFQNERPMNGLYFLPIMEKCLIHRIFSYTLSVPFFADCNQIFFKSFLILKLDLVCRANA